MGLTPTRSATRAIVSGWSGSSRRSAVAASTISSRVTRGGRPRRGANFGRAFSSSIVLDTAFASPTRPVLPRSLICDNCTHKTTHIRLTQARRGVSQGGAESVSQRRLIQLVVVAAASSVLGVSSVHAGAATATQPAATDIGVTGSEIRIGVIADVDTPLAPGAFKGARDAVLGFGRYINQHGGLAGRKVAVDFYDSKLSPDETRNAIIAACQKDFAVVGTGALFMNNVDDMVNCADAKGQKTGLPDVPIVTIFPVEQASPVSFPITAPAQDFSDPSGQTYRAQVGRFRWYLKNASKDLHGIFLVGTDFAALKAATLPIWAGAQKVGIKSDGVFGVSGLDPQDKFLPMVTALQSH